MRIETWISVAGAVVAVALATLYFGPLGIVYSFVLAIIGGAVAVAIYKGSKSLKS